MNSVRHCGSTNGITGEIEQNCRRGDGDGRFRTNVRHFSTKLHGVAFRIPEILPFTACEQTSYPLARYSFNVTNVFRTKIVFVCLISLQPIVPANISLTIELSMLPPVISSAKDHEICIYTQLYLNIMRQAYCRCCQQ